MDLQCPLHTLKYVKFNCTLFSITNGQTFNVSVNFNGVLFQNYLLMDQNVTLTYSFNTTGPLQVNALLPENYNFCGVSSQDGLNITKIIQGKKILKTTLLKILLIDMN